MQFVTFVQTATYKLVKGKKEIDDGKFCILYKPFNIKYKHAGNSLAVVVCMLEVVKYA